MSPLAFVDPPFQLAEPDARANRSAHPRTMPTPKPPAVEIPTLSFATPDAFAEWVARNHATSRGVWIRFAKKDSGIASVTYKEAVDIALCWGWIDGQAKRVDDTWYDQRFTPRTSRSIWSKINRGKVAELIAAERMQPAGLAEVERAKADGRWDRAYDSPSSATVPDDLTVALAGNAKAAAFFDTLNSQNRYAILHRIQTAKKPETKQKRIRDFVAMLARGEKIHS